MRLLLDTHVWLWCLLEPERLSGRAMRLLRSPGSELWLSSISVWEVLVLAERGRIVLSGDVDDWLAEAAERAPLHEAPVTHEIAPERRRVGLTHEDPADRLLAATAKVLELTLVTADERLLAGRGFATFDCR